MHRRNQLFRNYPLNPGKANCKPAFKPAGSLRISSLPGYTYTAKSGGTSGNLNGLIRYKPVWPSASSPAGSMNPFPYLAASVCLLTVLYVTGGFIVYAFRLPVYTSWQAVFIKLFAGTLGTVFLYAVAVTKGNTVNMGLLIPFLIPFIVNRRKGKPTVSLPLYEVFRPDRKKAIELLGIALPVFFFFFFLLSDRQLSFPVPPHPDYIYYARLADYLNATGIENMNLPLTGDYIPPVPYHYFEIWLNALLAKATGLPALLTQQLICHVTLFVMLYCGLLALAEAAGGTPGLGLRILAISFFFFQGIRWPLLDETLLQDNDYFFYASVLFHKKYLFPYLVFCAFLVHAFQKRNTAALLTLLVLPVISASSSIPVLAAILLFLGLNHLKRLCHFNIRMVLGAVIATALFLYLFYALREQADPRFSLEHSAAILETNIRTILHSGLLVSLFLNNLFLALLLFLPVILIISFQFRNLMKRETYRVIVILVLLLVTASSAAFSLWYQKYDSSQLFSNTGMTVLTLAIFSTLVWLYIQSGLLNFRYALLVLLSVWSLYQLDHYISMLSRQKESYARSYSRSYIKEVSEALQPLDKAGGRICNTERLRTFKDFALDLNACPWFLGHLKNNFRILSLDNISNIPLSLDSFSRLQEKEFLESQQFQKFIRQEKGTGSYLTVNDSRLEFIRKNRIGFIFVEKPEMVDSALDQLVIKTISDSLSGEKLLILSDNFLSPFPARDR